MKNSFSQEEQIDGQANGDKQEEACLHASINFSEAGLVCLAFNTFNITINILD